jgi:LPS-assembly protein
MTRLHKFNLKKFCFILIGPAFCLIITTGLQAQLVKPAVITNALTKDTIPSRPGVRNSMLPPASSNKARGRDTIPRNDSLSVPSIDTFNLRISKDTLDAPVVYEAEDSAVLLIKEKIFLLYGNTKTTYNDVVLTAPRVEMNQSTNIVTAYSQKDSLDRVVQRARFKQGEENFQSDIIQFNFKTQKGLTQNTFTRQDEFFVNASVFKKINATTTFARRVIMTTCDFDEPHFGFVSSKGKFIANKIAVTGPIHPEFEGVPVPIYLPFGVFPLNKGRHSGLLPPQFTVNEQFGIGLEGLGYYHVINDYFDVTLRGNLYSYGGWSANIIPTYRKRYKYSGGFNFSLQHTKFNFKGDPDYNLQKTFLINWNHNVDQKAKPGTSFAASVNAGSTKYNQFLANNPMRNVQNQMYSSISYSKTWVGKPYNLTLSANHTQNNNTRLINIMLPDAGFTVATINPFQRKEIIGTPKWYEKIGVGYQGNFRNQLSFYDTAQRTIGALLDTLQWGAQHRLPLIMALPPLGKFIVSPSINYEETWLTHRMVRRWNDIDNKVDTVTSTKGFFADRQISFGVGFNTTVYGTFAFKGEKLKAIRHVVRPNFSLNYKPNLSKRFYDVIQTSQSGRVDILSQFQDNFLFRGYGYGKFGGMSFGIDNNLEMKWASKKDSAGAAPRNIRLIDGFGFTSGYNFLQDSLKLQPFSLYLRSTLFEKLNLTAQALLDPYQADSFGRQVDRFMWDGNRFSLGRITSGSISMSTRFQSKPRTGTEQQGPQGRPLNPAISDPTLLGDQQRLQDYMRRNPAEFVDFDMPWSLDLNFSLTFYRRLKQDYSGFETEITSNVSFNNSFSLTPKWNFSTTGFYDFNAMKLSQFQMSISRDMHCWQMSVNIAPISQFRYFNITISPKSSVLQDLRVNRTRYFSNY